MSKYENSKSYLFNDEILKACDIRGVYGDELTTEGAYHIGRAFGTVLQQKGLKTCAVGFDGRHSSPMLTDRLIAGLTESGISVLLAGLVPTPVIYHVVETYPADSGVIVTASHNPAEDNGFKFLFHKELFHGQRIEQLAEISRDGAYYHPDCEGTVRKIDVIDTYLEVITAGKPNTGLKVVWDPGNGASAVLIQSFVERLPGEHRIICGEVDGSFPNHHPNPTQPENMKMLSEAVVSEGADLGIAFDGDGDRIGAVDGKGRVLTGDQLLVIFARDYLAENPGSAVMSEVKASAFFYQDVLDHGGVPLMWKVGHANQKEKMQKEQIEFAGETSGHIFFSENYGVDDGMFAAVKLVKILADGTRSLAEIVDAFPKIYSTGEIRLKLGKGQRLQLVADIKKRLEAEKREVITIDGVRVPCASGFWMLRSSNTQPHITTNCESNTERGLADCMQEMVSQIAASGYVFDDLVVP